MRKRGKVLPNLLPHDPPDEPDQADDDGTRGGGGATAADRGGDPGRLSAPVEILVQRGSFAHGELELAEASGVPLRELRAMRQKIAREKVHWAHIEQHVRYTEAGLRLVLAALSMQPPAESLVQELLRRTAAAEKEAPDELATITRFYLNPRLFQVRLADGSTGDVRVRTRVNLRVGMEVPVRRAGPIYILARRLPRFPGRW